MKFSSIHYAGLATILFQNLVEEYGFVIGRADKRYTLWKYNHEGDALNIAFVQVLSDKRHRVEQRFPGIYICEELRGEHRLTLTRSGGRGKSKPATAPKTIYDFMDIPFGCIRGTKIVEAGAWAWVRFANAGEFKWTDAWGEEFDFEPLVMSKLEEFKCGKVAGQWYTPEQMENPKLWMWLANTTEDHLAKPEYDSMCRLHGLQKLMGRWYSPIALEDEKPWMTTARQILPSIEKGEAFSFVAHFNGNGFFFGVPVEFREEDKKDVYTYYGSSHMLYITNKKGVKVAKRTKGKTIEVLEYEVLTDGDNNPYVMVNKFNIK
jgi:hypothetical protein